MSIQKRINALQPHVVQMRFMNGVAIVDVVFKKGWKVPKSKYIEGIKGDNTSENYYMFYTEKEDLGIDDVLDFIEEVIEINVEREKKLELLKIKVEELKELFKENKLSVLEGMKFDLGHEQSDDYSINDMSDDIDIGEISSERALEKDTTLESQKTGDELIKEDEYSEQKSSEEEVNNSPVYEKVGSQTIELPPKEEVTVKNYEEPDVVCNCGPEDACPECIEDKY